MSVRVRVFLHSLIYEKEFKKRIPMWYKDITQYELCLTDDIDSLLSCVFREVLDWH